MCRQLSNLLAISYQLSAIYLVYLVLLAIRQQLSYLGSHLQHGIPSDVPSKEKYSSDDSSSGKRQFACLGIVQDTNIARISLKEIISCS
jgi:hypothetical protein